MDLTPDVQIVGLRGGYVIETQEKDPESEDWTIARRVCLSIDEVLKHVRRTLELVDQHPERSYASVERNMNGA